MSITLRRWLAPLALALALVGCNFNLDEPTLVKTPRILAIVSDHPEANPGQDVLVRVLAVDPMQRELHYTFRACIDTTTFLGGSAANGSGGTSATMPMCTPMPSTGDEGTMPGALTQQLVAILDAIPASSGFDPAFLHRVLATAGLPITIRVEVSAADPMTGQDVLLVSGERLVGITTRAPTTNPPYIYFRVITEPPEQALDADPVETTYIGGIDPAHPFDCVPWYGEPATATVSQPTAVSDPGSHREHPEEWPNHITLAPADDPNLWEESFPIYDFSGTVRTGYEGAYYSWYSTASLPDRHGVVHSGLHVETTQGPSHGAEPSAIDDTIRNNTLDVPREPGTYDLWVVVRDGHLGTVACHLTIEATAAP